MERGQPDVAAVVPEQLFDAAAHFLRGLVRERDREHFAWRGVAAAHEIRDPVSDDARLAGSGARQDQQGAVHLKDGLALLRIQ